MNGVAAETAAGQANETPLRGAFSSWFEWVGDRLNPILVKETRQSLKSRQFTLWFVLLLIGAWVTTLGAVALVGPSIYYVSAGKYFLYAYYVLLAVPLVVVAPFSAYRSLSSEHEENSRDLLEVSTLTPRQVIHGKLASAALQIVVYLSALAPCLAFTYLLRGVDLVAIGLLLAYAVLASFGLSAVGLLLAASSRQKYSQVVMSVTFAGVLFTALAGLLSAAGGVLWLESRELRSDGFWWLNAGMLSLYATTLAVVYAGAVSLTTFSSANRSTAIRWAAMAQQTVFVAWVAGGVLVGLDREALVLCLAVAVFYWFVAGALMTGESPTLSQRVRRSLPQSLLGRFLFTWMNPGSGSGYVLAVSNVATLSAMVAVATQTAPIAKGAALLTAYLAGLLGLGRLTVFALRRVTEVSSLGCFLIQVLIALGACGLPFVVQTLAEGVRVSDLTFITAPSPAWNVPRVFEEGMPADQELTLMVTVYAAAGAIFLVNLMMAGHEARQLRMATPRRVLEDDREQKPAHAEQGTNPWGDRPEPEPFA